MKVLIETKLTQDDLKEIRHLFRGNGRPIFFEAHGKCFAGLDISWTVIGISDNGLHYEDINNVDRISYKRAFEKDPRLVALVLEPKEIVKLRTKTKE